MCITLRTYLSRNKESIQDAGEVGMEGVNERNLNLAYLIYATDVSMNDITDDALAKLSKGEDLDEITTFHFIQQALFQANQRAANYTQVNVTLLLTKGNHFFIQCEEQLKESEVGPHNHDKLCTIPSMRAFQPTTDNVKLVVRALDCNDDDLKSKFEESDDLQTIGLRRIAASSTITSPTLIWKR